MKGGSHSSFASLPSSGIVAGFELGDDFFSNLLEIFLIFGAIVVGFLLMAGVFAVLVGRDLARAKRERRQAHLAELTEFDPPDDSDRVSAGLAHADADASTGGRPRGGK